VAEAWSAGRGRVEAAELARLAQELADERERDSDKDREWVSEREPGAGAQAAEELARLAQELADERRAGEELRAQLEERARAAAEALAEVARVRRAGGQVEEKVDELEKQVRARHIGRGAAARTRLRIAS
jgi:chromosome segregation ATPase